MSNDFANARIIYVYDERFESGPRFVAMHKNVPSEWTGEMILNRLGLSAHLCVYEEKAGKKDVCIQHGDRYSAN